MNRLTEFSDLLHMPVLYPQPQSALWVSADGEVRDVQFASLPDLLAEHTPLICHRRWTEAKIHQGISSVWTNALPEALPDALDVLELFTFVRPARFCLPTPAGLAEQLDLPRPANPADAAITIAKAALALCDQIRQASPPEQRQMRDIAEMMAKGGWGWGPLILDLFGTVSVAAGPPDGRQAAVWAHLPDAPEAAPRPEPGIKTVMPDAARARLADMLGSHAEPRRSQSDYAAATAAVFGQPNVGPDNGNPEDGNRTSLLLSEAETGTGKTLGYLAPASLWAEMNDAPVWISTYTRTLQHQIATELSRLPPRPDRERKNQTVVIRKGRENYLCLLNLQEALAVMPGQPKIAIPLGLMARWVAHSPDGDLTGPSFPAWLVDLVGPRYTTSLSDRRGECIHSACTHYQKCFVEKSIRAAKSADIVVANHALVILQAVWAGPSERDRPTRYIFDEGHHVFEAADAAFSATLSAIEAAEMRRWVRGSEDGRGGRARGLTRRLDELLADDSEALALLEDGAEAARILPAAGWGKRLSENNPAGVAEAFFAALRTSIYARTSQPETLYDIQTPLYPVPDTLIEPAQKLAEALDQLIEPLELLAKKLTQKLDDEAANLDSQMRARLEGAIRGLTRRAAGPLSVWALMLRDCAGEGRDGFIDWMQIGRIEGQDRDVGLHRHYLDPSAPFAEQLLKPAHGVAITSATLRDITSDQKSDQQPDKSASWQSAQLLTGAAHLSHPAMLSHHDSPFDYARQAKIFIVTDLARDRPEATASAMAALMQASGGGALGLFTAIQRLKSVYPSLQKRLDEMNLPLYGQHVDRMNLQTLLALFRADKDSCLIGTDAVRDGIDVPGEALRMIIYDRVPWPRPDILFKARADWQGRDSWTSRATRMKLRQAFGRLVRQQSDRGVFVMLDNRLPTRLTTAFPAEIEVQRLGLADTISSVRQFFSETPPLDDAPLDDA